jgi:hypothetical protein
MKPVVIDQKSSLLIKDVAEIFTSIKNKAWYWKIGLSFLLVVFPLLLLSMQYLILTTIPPQVTISYLILNFSQPTISGMFFTNYIHNVSSISHLLDNYNGYLFVMFLLAFVYFIFVPLLKKRHILSLNYPDLAFFGTSAVFFLLFPFAESGMSILFGRMIGQTGAWGFSGIVWAFLAYFYFLFLMIMYDLIITRFSERLDGTVKDNTHENQEPAPGRTGRPEKPSTTTLVSSLIFLTALFIILPLYTIFLDIGNKKISVFGHFSGFVLGFLISALVVQICESRDKTGKIILIIILGLLLGIPAVLWMGM